MPSAATGAGPPVAVRGHGAVHRRHRPAEARSSAVTDTIPHPVLLSWDRCSALECGGEVVSGGGEEECEGEGRGAGDE